MDKLASVKSCITAVEFLSLMKREYTHKQLSELLGLPVPVLSRYVTGRVLPHPARSRMIMEFFEKEYLAKLVRSKASQGREGIYDVTPIIQDILLQRFIAKIIFKEFHGVRVDRVLTAETSGVPLAVQAANEFNANITISKRSKELGVDSFVEERVVFAPGIVEYFYIPKGAIKRGESILIVDDIVRTGATLSALVKLVERNRAKVCGIYVALSIGGAVRQLRSRLNIDCPVRSFVTLP